MIVCFSLVGLAVVILSASVMMIACSPIYKDAAEKITEVGLRLFGT